MLQNHTHLNSFQWCSWWCGTWSEW